MSGLESKLKELRQKRSWTQEELALEIGVSLSTIQRWERTGVKKKPIRLARKELQRLFEEAGMSYDTSEPTN